MSNQMNSVSARGNSAAILSAAVAAGAVSGVASIINEARKRGKTTSDHAADVVRANIDQSSSDLRERLGPATEAAKERIASLESSGRTQAHRVASQVSERAANLDFSSADLKERLGPVTEAAKEKLAGVESSGRAQAQRVATQVSERAANIAGAASQANLGPRVGQARTQLDQVVSDVVERGKKAVPAYAAEIEALAEKHVLPRVHDATQRVSALADGVVTSGREQGRQATDQLASGVKETVEDAGKRFSESLSSAEKSLGEWKGAASSFVNTVESGAKTAAGQAGTGGRNAGAAVLWMGAAGAVIYVGLLNPEQRRRLRDAGGKTFHKAIEMYRDIRGRDGTFDDSGTSTTA